MFSYYMFNCGADVAVGLMTVWWELITAGRPPYFKNYLNTLKFDFAKIFINTF